MLTEAVRLEGIPPLEEIRTMDEVDLMARLRSSGNPDVRELIKALDDRRLYKRVLHSGIDPPGEERIGGS